VKFVIIIFILSNVNGLSGQQFDVDSINFYNDSLFVQMVNRKANEQIDFVEYSQVNGNLKKVDYYDSKQRVIKDQIWNKELIREINYSYFEKGQIIKRYDVTNQMELPPVVNVYIRYPAMARENQIEGIVEVLLTYNEDCIPISYQILNKLGHGIDEEVEKKIELMIQLSEKHKVPFKECEKANENFKVKFKLE
jgi:hypothetical protein